ncbi:M23 family metallopeptidase [Sphingomonas sp. MMS24-JH45]
MNLNADAQFRSLFMTWKKLDKLEQGDRHPLGPAGREDAVHQQFRHPFGSVPRHRCDARGRRHPRQDRYADLRHRDGVVAHAARQGGYGNMIEVNHGKGIATRYGHLSKIIVADNTRVTRGQLIGLMGSTGRSTGPHLHYEVRIDGHAVNPVPFLTTGDYAAAQDRAVGQIPGVDQRAGAAGLTYFRNFGIGEEAGAARCRPFSSPAPLPAREGSGEVRARRYGCPFPGLSVVRTRHPKPLP